MTKELEDLMAAKHVSAHDRVIIREFVAHLARRPRTRVRSDRLHREASPGQYYRTHKPKKIVDE